MAGRKKTGWWPTVVAAVITFSAGVLFVAYLGPYFVTDKKAPRPKDFIELDVYFTNSRGDSLEPERKRVRRGTIESEARQALEILVNEGGKRSTLPPGTRLLSVKLKGDILYADFSRELIERHGGGSSGELITVYSIVNTVTLNFPQIKKVQILVEGQKKDTIAGHIDISEPLGPLRKVKTKTSIG